MDLELEQLIGVARIVFYLGIAFMLGVWYKPKPDASPRIGVSIIATLIAGCSFSLATMNILTWDSHQLATAKEIAATIFVGLWFLVTVRAGGNMAKIFTPRGAWR